MKRNLREITFGWLTTTLEVRYLAKPHPLPPHWHCKRFFLLRNCSQRFVALDLSIQIQSVFFGPNFLQQKAGGLKKEKWIEEMEGSPPRTFRVNSNVFWATYGVYKNQSFQEPLEIPKDKAKTVAVLKGVPILVLKSKRKKS